jgi:hypothetical protein
MPRRRRPRAVQDERPSTLFLPDGTVDPRAWEIVRTSTSALEHAVAGHAWFVAARPIEVHGEGVQLEVVVRWVSSDVWRAVPLTIDGYPVDVVLEGESSAVHTIH